MKNIRYILGAAALSLVFLFAAGYAKAATLMLVPSNIPAGIGDKVFLDLKVDSSGVSFNAAQATIRFPKDTVQVDSVDKTGSAFSFWLSEPTFSNADGVLSFTGGTPFGISGGAIQILKIVFIAKAPGAAQITLNDAAITASDGSGTNILSKLSNGAINVSPTNITPSAQIPPPQKITRTPVPAAKVPVQPALEIPLYPDQTQWYGVISPFNVRWALPADVSGISTYINKQPKFDPLQESDGLFDNETFNALSDGIWYLHIRFQNNVGWGPTANYRIAIDTQPPENFQATILEGETTEIPNPTLQFKTTDALSGLKSYLVRVDDGNLTTIPANAFTGSYKLPLQLPGKHQLVLEAVDQAGNSVEDRFPFEIVPIESPTITFTTTNLFSNTPTGLNVKGTALPNVNVLLSVKSRGALIVNATATVDEKGNWEYTFDQPLRDGLYVVEAQSQDAKGALSLVVKSSSVHVSAKPILQIGSFSLGSGGVAIILFLVLAIGFGAGYWFFYTWQKKLTLRVQVAQLDVSNMFKLIEEDLEKLRRALGTETPADEEFSIKRLEENIKKIEGYLAKGIGKINK